MTVLYIIGNGFDLHHGIPTAYKHFGSFLRKHYRQISAVLDEYLPTYVGEDFWSHFEEHLADFDAETLVENSEQFIASYGADDWRDADHHRYAQQLDMIVETLSRELLDAFTVWVRQIQVPAQMPSTTRRARIDPGCRFISFNYTDTLQQLYGLADSHVWHIHGRASRNDRLILGHAWNRTGKEKWIAKYDPDRDDPRQLEGAGIIDRYFAKTFKPTDAIISENTANFASLHDVAAVHVLGHSLGDVDMPYLKKIAQSIHPAAQWRISYHDSPDEAQKQSAKFAYPGQTSFWLLPDV